jgi:fatty acid desaturase
MFDLWRYQDALGKPGEGIHSYRVVGIAIADVVMTIVAAFAISYFSGFNFWILLAILFLSGIVLHRLFHVRTTLDKALFPNA